MGAVHVSGVVPRPVLAGSVLGAVGAAAAAAAAAQALLALDLDAALGRGRGVVGHVPRVGLRVDEASDERDVTLVVRRRRGLDHLGDVERAPEARQRALAQSVHGGDEVERVEGALTVEDVGAHAYAEVDVGHERGRAALLDVHRPLEGALPLGEVLHEAPSVCEPPSMLGRVAHIFLVRALAPGMALDGSQNLGVSRSSRPTQTLLQTESSVSASPRAPAAVTNWQKASSSIDGGGGGAKGGGLGPGESGGEGAGGGLGEAGGEASVGGDASAAGEASGAGGGLLGMLRI